MPMERMTGGYISREAAIEEIKSLYPAIPLVKLNIDKWHEKNKAYMECETAIERIPAADVRLVPDGGIGEMSDGYHTFNGLYYQRMVLFAALVKAHKDNAWKSWKHEDGEPCFEGGWFIVGIDTPQGSYTYHYEAKYFDLFECEELPTAKHWDGHTEKDVTRLLSLDVRPVVRGKWIQTTQPMGWCDEDCAECSVCGEDFVLDEWAMDEFTNLMNFCPNCGADMREES